MAGLDFCFPLPNGLHARPASRLQELCRGLEAKVALVNRRNGRRADAASALALVSSDTAGGDPCRLEIEGAAGAVETARRRLKDFLERELPHADDDPENSVEALSAGESRALPPPLARLPAGILAGLPVSAGIGRGRALFLHRPAPPPRRFACGRRDAKAELKLFREALARVETALEKKAAGAGKTEAAILGAQRTLLTDPAFSGQVAERIACKGWPAGSAIGQTADELAGELARAQSLYLRERAADLRDLAGQLADELYGRSKAGVQLTVPSVVAADDLLPSQLLALDPRRLAGVALGRGGSTSHLAILARTRSIPCVAGLGPALGAIAAGTELIVDGARGLLIPAPPPPVRRWYRLDQIRERDRAGRALRLKDRPGRTADGRRLEIAANVGSAPDLSSAWASGAEGIGLLRTEILFLERGEPPGEREQLALYRRAVKTACGKRVILRTLDIGADKPLAWLALGSEANPNLGWRAVRFYEAHAPLLRTQLRAALRAAADGPLQVMVPMVTCLEEIRLVRRLMGEAEAELARQSIPHAASVSLGVMVETPAAALMTEALSAEADFFSIGSNDLLQYVMAADRGHPRLASLLDPLQPAFLRLLRQAVAGARAAGRWIGICGEMAGDPQYLPLLVGLGLDELSMAPARIPTIKARLAGLDSASCGALLEEVLACSTASGAAEKLRGFAPRLSIPAPTGLDLILLDRDVRSRAEAVKILCDALDLSGRAGDGDALEIAVWAREEVYATDLGLGFALPHAKSASVRAPSIAFLRPKKPLRWATRENPPVRGVILLAVPEAGANEHLKLIARLSRKLMDEEYREALLGAPDQERALALLNGALQDG